MMGVILQCDHVDCDAFVETNDAQMGGNVLGVTIDVFADEGGEAEGWRVTEIVNSMILCPEHAVMEGS